MVVRVDGEAVARKEQFLGPVVADREGPHPVEAQLVVGSRLRIRSEDGLVVGAQDETVAKVTKLNEIVDLAVKREPIATAGIGDRLLAVARPVDDGEAAMAEPEAVGREMKNAAAVGSAMSEAIATRREGCEAEVRPGSCPGAGDTAHELSTRGRRLLSGTGPAGSKAPWPPAGCAWQVPADEVRQAG